MDIRTILICLLMVNFFLGIFMTISLKTQKTYPGYSSWAASTLLVFFIYCLYSLRGIIPDFFSVIIATTLISVVGVLRITGISLFFNRPIPGFFYIIPFVIFALICLFNISGTRPFINFLIISICITIFSSYIAYVYWINIQEGSKLLFGTTIFVLILYSAMSAGRAIYWHFNPDDALLLKSTKHNILFFLLSIGVDILWATLFFTMNSYRLTAELAEKNDELEKINVTKDKFFSIIAHDLQGPVGNINQYLDQIITDYDLYSEEKKLFALSRLSKSIKKTFDLLVNLLEWAKDQTGMILFRPVELSIAGAVDDVINLYRSTAYDKKITVINSIPPELTAIADRDMLITVLRNFLSNAIKFSSHGESIEIFAEEKNGYIEITVSDNGIGFPENDTSSIFKIDSFISSQGTDNETGSGLGLIICKEFIERHNGELRIKIKEKGCDVTFTLEAS